MTTFPKMDFSTFAMPKVDPARTAQVMAAMVKLQKRHSAAYTKWAEARRAAAHGTSTTAEGGVIDMVAPATPGGSWTAPGATSGKPETSAFAGPQGDIAGDVMRTIRASLAKAGLGEGTGGIPGAPVPAPTPLPDGARFEERTFASAIGSRNYKIYVPSGYAGQSLPVVVMLHGCTQDPDDFARGTRMNEIAEEQTFLVAYPEQPRSANMQRCWNWYEAGEQRREGGEAALIAGITRQVIAEFSADPTRVYAAGLSAGGAAAAILATTYPDLFAAVGVHSGLACGSARDMPSAFAAMSGRGVVAPGSDRVFVPMIVFHGDGDRTVHAVNGNQVIAQAGSGMALHGHTTEGRTVDGMAYTRTVQTDASGRSVLEQWVLHGAGHAWSGGSPAGSFTDPRGPDASREMLRFFFDDPNATGSVQH